MSLRLCGRAPGVEAQNINRITAESLHDNIKALVECNQTEVQTYGYYSSLEIVNELNSIVESAEDILFALNQGNPVDLQGTLIDRVTIGRELEVLSSDLQTVDQVVNECLGMPHVQALWHAGIITTVDFMDESAIPKTTSLYERCERIRELSGQMRARKKDIIEKIAEDRRALMQTVDTALRVSSETTVPLEITQLIGSYLPIE